MAVTIYVDALSEPATRAACHGDHAAQASRVGKRNGHQWCHLFATGGDVLEIHAFAAQLGMKRKWFDRDHYDLTKAKRELAVTLGAVEVTRREAVAILRPRTKPADTNGGRE